MQLEGLAPARSRSPLLGVEDLAVYERHGGHALSRHVGLSAAEVVQRVRDGDPAAGCFTNRAVAQEAVDAAIQRRRDRIREWLSGRGSGSRYTFAANLGRVVGTSLTRHDISRGRLEPSPATAVRCVLRRSEHLPEGFTLVTAYPTRAHPGGRHRRHHRGRG